MSTFINKGNDGFSGARQGEYIDKSGLIAVINSTLGTERRFSCVSRSRRFGKSMAVKMLCAYYDESCDSHSLFDDLHISEDASYVRHLNKYPVIYLDISDFTTKYGRGAGIASHIQEDIIADLLDNYPEVKPRSGDDLMDVLADISARISKKFIFLIDEWDAILRELEGDREVIDAYVNLLRRLFKGSSSSYVFAGVYMTGILPIKKYKTESALNNFREYSLVAPGALAEYFGFTVNEVQSLCSKYCMDFSEVQKWYDGYMIGDVQSIFNPYSVMEAMENRRIRSYWSSTGAYESVSGYIQMNFEGLKDDLIKMLAGDRCRVNTTKFQNDLSVIGSKDDVLTILIHLGYLSYDWNTFECYIPNKEISDEITNAVESTSWNRLAETLNASRNLLEAALNGDADSVARGVDLAHDEHTSILSYNDENSLACVLSIAFYYAQNDYVIHREFASGKGYADLVLLPRRNVQSPAMVIELKFDKTADTAIDQIKRKEYVAKVADYSGQVLLVGISHNRKSKRHQCRIERLL